MINTEKSKLLRLRIDKIVHETEDTVSILFSDIHGKEYSFKPGQFLTFVFDRDGKEVRRCYSIFTTPDDLPQIGVAIKKVPGGFVSDGRLDNLKVGDELDALVPMGNFTRKGDPKKYLLLFGAGSGITPLLSIIQDSLKDPFVERITLHYANRNEDNIIFKDRLEEFEVQHPGRFQVIHHLSQPKDEKYKNPGKWDLDKIVDFFKSFPEEEKADTGLFLCGPQSLMEHISLTAIDYGFDKRCVRREVFAFSISNESRLPMETVERDVTIIFEGRSYEITVYPGNSILDTALEAGIDLPYSCQYGSCGTCITKLVSGKVVMQDQTALSDEEIADGFCLTCVGYPASDHVILNYDDPSL